MATPNEYWNKIYSAKPFDHGKDADSFFDAKFATIAKGKTLDVGMGEGQNAVFLAENGFNVRGFDISETAVDHAKSLAKERNVSILAERTDLDLFVMGLMEYDSIIMINFKPPITRYYSELVRALKQGGTLLVRSLMDSEMPEAFGPEDGYKNFYYHTNELIKSLRDLQILFYNEDIENGQRVVQCLARKPLDKDAAKYKLFDMQTTSTSAGPDRQRELAEALFKKKS